MTDEAEIAGVLAIALDGRPERLTALALAQEPPEMRAACGAATEAVASLGLAADLVAPSAGLRGPSRRARLASLVSRVRDS